MKALSKIRLPLLMLAAGAIALTLAAGMMMFSTFMLYDDEGYVLLSLRNFAEHGHLYGDVYTQYGPFSYVLYYGLHLLGLPLTHVAGRTLTLAAWSGSATLTAWLVWRVTRHSACMLATLSAVFVYLWIMVSEPNHPGGLIALVAALMATLGYHWLTQGRWTAWALLAGVGSGILMLTKINIGVFATLSSMALLLLHARNDGVRRWAPWLLAAALLALPFVLMRPLLGTPWVYAYALLFAFAAIPIAFSVSRVTTARTGGREWLRAVLGGAGVMAVVLAMVFARGTTPAELLQGVVLGPLHHPGHFSLRFLWPAGALTLASASFGLFLLTLAALRLGRPRRLTIDTLVVVLRLAAAAGLALLIYRFPAISPDNQVFAYSLSCLWLFLWPLTGEDESAVVARGWLGLLFVGQWLHPFPVPGSQIAWGTFLAIPLAVIGAWQGAVWLTEQRGRTFNFRRAQAIDLTLTLALTMLAVVTGNRLAQIGARYLESRPLNLPGAEPLHLPDSTTALYQMLALNLREHSDMVFSLPGMFSFNLWSNEPTPTLQNVTHWFSLLGDTEQRAIIAALERHPRACVIVQQPHLDFLRKRQLTPSGPLYDYVMQEFVSAFEIDGFEFRVHRGRKIVPLQSAELFEQKSAAPTASASEATLVKLRLRLPDGQTVASATIGQMDGALGSPLTLNQANARIEITPIDLEGHPRGPTATGAFPFTPRGPVEVSLYFDRQNRGLSVSETFFILRDPAGAEIALVRLLP